MKNMYNDPAKIVIAALTTTLVSVCFITNKMLRDSEHEVARYRNIIDQKNRERSELMSKTHELEWKLQQVEGS